MKKVKFINFQKIWTNNTNGFTKLDKTYHGWLKKYIFYGIVKRKGFKFNFVILLFELDLSSWVLAVHASMCQIRGQCLFRKYLRYCFYFLVAFICQIASLKCQFCCSATSLIWNLRKFRKKHFSNLFAKTAQHLQFLSIFAKWKLKISLQLQQSLINFAEGF